MSRTVLFVMSACAALCAGAAFAQEAEAAPADPHDGVTMPADRAPASASPLGFAPMFLEIGPGETLGLPRSYEQRPCGDDLMPMLFAGEVEQEFLDSLRCWVVPVEHSDDFAQTLDQAIVRAGWTYAGAAGEIVHYRRGSQELDIRVFWLGDYYGRETQDRGFLFGVVGERDEEAAE